MTTIDRLVSDYCTAIQDETAAVFAGAGLSIPAGMVNWSELLREIAADIGLDVDRESDLVSVAQFHVNEHGGRARINQALVAEFSERAQQTENHRVLSRLPIRHYWTTNYDVLIEESIREARRRPDVKITDASIATTRPRRDAVVYKMHGDVSAPEKAIVTRDDYESYPEKFPVMSTALRGDLVSKTFLFIGFSFSDPNLQYLLSLVRLTLRENRRDHYCLMRQVARADHDSDSDFDYATIRQQLQIKDLRRYGVHTVLVPSFADITSVLLRIDQKFRRSIVVVSGSAETYAPMDAQFAERLLRMVGRGLIERGFDIVTGFGVNVGAQVLAGALEALREQGSIAIHDRVILRPFPSRDADVGATNVSRQAYREDFIALGGIALFLFGNRVKTGGAIELANGVIEEFEIARAKGLALLPISATGHASAVLVDRLRALGAMNSPLYDLVRSEMTVFESGGTAEEIAAAIVGAAVKIREAP